VVNVPSILAATFASRITGLMLSAGILHASAAIHLPSACADSSSEAYDPGQKQRRHQPFLAKPHDNASNILPVTSAPPHAIADCEVCAKSMPLAA